MSGRSVRRSYQDGQRRQALGFLLVAQIALALTFTPCPALANSDLAAASASAPATKPADGATKPADGVITPTDTVTEAAPGDDPVASPGDEPAADEPLSTEPATDPAPSDDPATTPAPSEQTGEKPQSGDPTGGAPPPETGTGEQPAGGAGPDPATGGEQAPAPTPDEQSCAEPTAATPVNAQPAVEPPCPQPGPDTPAGDQPAAAQPVAEPPETLPPGKAATSTPATAGGASAPPQTDLPLALPGDAATLAQSGVGVADRNHRASPAGRGGHGAPAPVAWPVARGTASAEGTAWLMSVGAVPAYRVIESLGQDARTAADNDAARLAGAGRPPRLDSEPTRRSPITPPLQHTGLAASAAGSSGGAQQTLSYAMLLVLAAWAAYELRRFRFRLLVPAAPGAPSLRDRPG